MKKHLLILFAALLSLAASAQTKVEIEGIWYNLVSETQQAEVTKGGDYSGSITIPATVTYEGKEYSVTSIGEYAFDGCRSLTAINIPEGVTSIGESAFAWCGSLTAITIPEGVTSIGKSAFRFCRSLTAINIPEGVTSIGWSAFSGCESLTAITLPESVTSIGDDAFSDCSRLTAITIPENSQLTSIGGYAFYGCSRLTAITIPEGVTSIGEYAFYDCSSLKSITIPEGVTSIGNYTFSGCTRLKSITIPEGVTSIGEYAFSGCESLTVITIPEGVTSIGEYAFSGCESFTAITIPEGVRSIGAGAFYGCTSLTAITIPEGVTSIQRGAFQGCSKLTTITIPENSQLTSIGVSAFSGCSSLTAIVLPKTLNYIESQAFANCSELLDVYCYAEKVPSTYTNAFDGSYPEYITLHVPASALETYKTTAPWSSFGKFEIIKVIVDNITLSQSTATLYKGDELMLTATIIPDDATDKSISWSSSNPSVATVDNTGKVTAVSVGTATITAMANDSSKVSASCEVTIRLRTCATPTISYEDGKISLTCDTEDATIRSSVRDNNIGDYEVTEYNVMPTYTITAYATKENYEDSDVATLTLCWVPCDEDHEESDGILTIPAKPVLISTQGGTITVSGLAAGTAVAAYSTAGTQLATATDGTATLTTGLEAGSIAIVKMGDYSVKVAIK